MTWNRLARQVALCGLVVSLVSVAARAEDAAELVQKGFYLQVHDGNPEGAAAAFERVASDSGAPAALRHEAEIRLAQCREDLASADMARLMPPDAIAYLELNRPGDQLARLAKMMGLVHEPGAEQPVTDGQAAGIPLGNGFVFPANFSLSPALVAELKKLRGAAVAITGLDEQFKNMPEGVLVVHPGDCDLLRGVLETAVQLVQPDKPIEGFKTYRLENGPHHFWITVTARLLIAGTNREAVAATVERLKNPKAEGLATRPAFKAHEAERRDGLLFAYVDGHETARRLRSFMKGNEANMVAGLLDLEHLESLTLSVGVTGTGVQVIARVNLLPGHHNVAYNLIRTAPFEGRSLNAVPRGTAGVLLLGLNPATPAQTTKTPPGPVEVTGMDLGREIFANVEEVAVFALPSVAKSESKNVHMPEVAAVFAVKDAAKSEAIWNQILAIVAMVGVHHSTPHDVTIEGIRGEQYQFTGMPPIVVVRTADRALIVGTPEAATAAIRASSGKDSIKSDEAYAPLLARLTKTSSKAVLVDAGRVMQLVRMFSGGGSPELDIASAACKDLRVSIVTDEAPNCLTVSVEASGLPNVPSLISKIGGGPMPRSHAKK